MAVGLLASLCKNVLLYMLAYAMYLWPSYIKMDLSPFTLKTAERVPNNFFLDISYYYLNKKSQE